MERLVSSLSVVHHASACILSLAAGCMLLVANLDGGTLSLPALDQLKGEAENATLSFVPTEYLGLVPLTFALAAVVASAGAFLVLFAGFLFYRDNLRVARLCLALGAGTGVFGLLLLFGVGAYANELDRVVHWVVGPPGLAVFLIVLAEHEAKWARFEPRPAAARAQRAAAREQAKGQTPPATFRVERRGPGAPPRRPPH